MSYLKNLPLLAALMGLALGYAWWVGKRRDFRATFAPVLTVLVARSIFVGRIASPIGLAYPGSADGLLLNGALLILSGRTAIIVFAAMIFGESMRRVGEAPGPLASNLIGSVSGGMLECGSLLRSSRVCRGVRRTCTRATGWLQAESEAD